MRTNIIISPSQQTANRCLQGDSEADHCRIIAEKVVELLKKYECNPYLIPVITGAENDILQKVCNSSNYFCKMNPSDADYHLDIHTDAGYSATGSCGFYMSEGGKVFIQHIHKAVSSVTPTLDGIVSERNLKVLRDTTAVAGLIELSFHDKPSESLWIHDNMDVLAQAIVRGIVKACELVLKKVTEITDVNDAVQVLFDKDIINNKEYWKAMSSGIIHLDKLFLSMANFVKK